MKSKLQHVNIGFVPLVDCAVLAVAREKGIARAHGLDLSLSKEVSWANIRDKLFLGYLDGAHMLSPMALAGNLSLMPNSCEVVAPFVLGRNGNAITVSHDLYDAMQVHGPNMLERWDLSFTGQMLKTVIDERRKAGRPQLRFGMVFPFSCHNYHLRYWLAACGIDPDIDVHLQVVPPPFMDHYLEQGRLDGFCVGEPWNSLAVAQDIGVIIATTSQIWRQSPEKLLGLRKKWLQENPETVTGLLHALKQAADWAGDPVNLEELAMMLSDPVYLDVPKDIIAKALSGDLCLKNGGVSKHVEGFLSLNGDSCPHLSAAAWLTGQMERWGQCAKNTVVDSALKDAFSTQTYVTCLGAQAEERAEAILFDIA